MGNKQKERQEMRTRYRIMFNGEQYVIQEQAFRVTLFGKHWRRKWRYHTRNVEGMDGAESAEIRRYNDLETAVRDAEECKNCDKVNRYFSKKQRKQELALKKNIWKKVWP